SRSGARVMLVDEQSEFGGSLLASRQTIDGLPALHWVGKAVEELRGNSRVRLLVRSTVYAYLDHNFLTVAERRTDHLAPAERRGPREKLWKVRAGQVVLATGAQERPMIFGNNDRPGIMLASSVSHWINRYAVLPGKKAVLFTNNDSAYQTVLDLLDAGAEVAAVVDVRRRANGTLPARVKARGVQIYRGHAVVNTLGGRHLKAACLMRLNEAGNEVRDGSFALDCDLLAVSGGWSPVLHLSAQSGARASWSEALACFCPGTPVQAERSTGAAAGLFELADCLSDGFARGQQAAREAGFENTASLDEPVVEAVETAAIEPLWLVPSPWPAGRGPKQFVDLQNDVSAADIRLAAREGFKSIEHVKRYTAMGFGTDQGKLGNINGMAILAQTLGQSIPATGTTTFRPNYTPVSFGTIAGPDLGGELFQPVRKTALHAWHQENGALFENVGQWQRPWYYPRDGEDLQAAVERECLAVRNSVGIMDAGTLGKIDIKGPDAAEFLNRVYTNHWSKLKINHARYGLMLGEDGMLMDDGVTIRLAEDHFFMHTTTGGAAPVFAWLERWLQTEWPELQVYLTSVTDHWATAAVVGPDSRQVLAGVCDDLDLSAKAFPFMTSRTGTVAGVAARVNRISFSGELAYEVNVPANYARHVWEALMQAGESFDITPYGTETMHVLRAEKGYIIVGQDTDGSVTPIDLGMAWAVSKSKDFIGRRSLSRSDTARQDRKQLVGLLTADPSQVIPEGAQIIEDPQASVPVPMLGHVTSSYFSATLQKSIALALIENGFARQDQQVFAATADGALIEARVCQPVFLDPEGERQHV
ncbi:MAG: sarcosine oxidase subunit alpha, partial [Gammaproteobacteria bacterium]|nr:sarcosine oxidase subunit alpha [Gammaproteobacteria bacterium]